MRTNHNAVQPARLLAETARALEQAVLECLARPKVRAVHKVRTMTRRMEAQLTLLGLVEGFPPYEHQARRMRRVLRKLRRAAGAVRDLDVQQDLIRAGAEAMGNLTPQSGKEAGELGRRLRKTREGEAKKLAKLLKSARARLPKRWEALFEVLGPAEGTTIPEANLEVMVRDWYRAETKPYFEANEKDPDDPDRLHAIRKAAKLARYLAESVPNEESCARTLAAEFEAIQESGGKWHDWMILSELAGRELGASAVLPQRFAMHAADALTDFRRLIAGARPTGPLVLKRYA